MRLPAATPRGPKWNWNQEVTQLLPIQKKWLIIARKGAGRIDAAMCTPSLHPLSWDGELSLLLRKHTGAVSCSVLAWQSAENGLFWEIPAATQSGNLRRTYLHYDFFKLAVRNDAVRLPAVWGRWKSQTANIALALMEEMFLLMAEMWSWWQTHRW